MNGEGDVKIGVDSEKDQFYGKSLEGPPGRGYILTGKGFARLYIDTA